MVQNTIPIRQTVIVVGIITAAATVVGTYIYQKFKKGSIPTEWKAVGEVQKLCIYPFKSGKRIEVDKAKCTKQGLMETEKFDKSLRLRDRSFVVYHAENHEYRNSRHYPQMILVEIKALNMNCVIINAPKMSTLILELPERTVDKEVIIKHYKNEEIPSIDCGDDAATWISKYILEKNVGLRIAYHDGSFKRTQINELYKDKIDYYKRGLRNESTGLNSDLAAMHIINQASVLDINSKMGHSDVTADNFRSNLVVDGPNLKPYEEDNWEWVKVGDVVMKNVMECMRCSMPTVNIETGVRRKDREPLRTMEKFRISKGPEKAPVMGMLLEVFQTGTISVGDTVYVGKSS